jgi:hypothetical protein
MVVALSCGTMSDGEIDEWGSNVGKTRRVREWVPRHLLSPGSRGVGLEHDRARRKILKLYHCDAGTCDVVGGTVGSCVLGIIPGL